MITPHTPFPSADDWFGILVLAFLCASIGVMKLIQWRETRREHERRVRDRRARGALALDPMGLGVLERRVGDRRRLRK